MFKSLSQKDRHINWYSNAKSCFDIKRICPDIGVPYFTCSSQVNC